MNKEEYWSLKSPQSTAEYKFVHEKIRTWKQSNGITTHCVVHHRDDNEEVRAYNEEHYERWGFDENGDFIEGKYVVFMTLSEHKRYHLTGKPGLMKGKTHTDEAKANIREHNAHYWKGKKFSPTHIQHLYENHANFSAEGNPFYGKHHSDVAKEKMSAAKKAIKFLYNAYKNNGGIKKWNEFQKALKNGEITFETLPISVFVK